MQHKLPYKLAVTGLKLQSNYVFFLLLSKAGEELLQSISLPSIKDMAMIRFV